MIRELFTEWYESRVYHDIVSIIAGGCLTLAGCVGPDTEEGRRLQEERTSYTTRLGVAALELHQKYLMENNLRLGQKERSLQIQNVAIKRTIEQLERELVTERKEGGEIEREKGELERQLADQDILIDYLKLNFYDSWFRNGLLSVRGDVTQGGVPAFRGEDGRSHYVGLHLLVVNDGYLSPQYFRDKVFPSCFEYGEDAERARLRSLAKRSYEDGQGNTMQLPPGVVVIPTRALSLEIAEEDVPTPAMLEELCPLEVFEVYFPPKVFRFRR